MNWRDFYLRSTTADQDAVDAGTSYAAIIAKDPPNVLTQGYDVLTKAEGGTYETYGTVGFTNWLTLLEDIAPLDTELEVADANLEAFTTEFTASSLAEIAETVRPGYADSKYTHFDLDGSGYEAGEHVFWAKGDAWPFMVRTSSATGVLISQN